MSEEEFDRLFPGRHPLYRFAALQQALLFFPAAFNIGSYEIRRQEMAAFLANASHETGQFRIVREADEKNWPHYCDPGQIPCPEGRQYFGRGPIQLSWNYNYAAAGRALGLDLLHNPDLVEQDPLVAWSSALWFWTTQTGAGVMPSHYAIVSASGFRETIRSINGTLECGKSPSNIGHQQMRHRVELYLDIAGKLGVPPGDKLHC